MDSTRLSDSQIRVVIHYSTVRPPFAWIFIVICHCFVFCFFSFQHLLCLLLQALGCIALNPSYHPVLSEADIADMLMQLLLPSDEWYYTNHSTKYAKFVKYNAARILVYMGLLHKLGGRVDLFDRKRKLYSHF